MYYQRSWVLLASAGNKTKPSLFTFHISFVSYPFVILTFCFSNILRHVFSIEWFATYFKVVFFNAVVPLIKANDNVAHQKELSIALLN